MRRSKPEDPTLNIGNPLEGTLSPFTPARLHELYWKEGRPLTEIARMGNTDAKSVNRWMKLCDIRTRTVSEGRKMAYKRFPYLHDLNREKFRKMHEDGKQGRMPIERLRKVAMKGLRKSWKSNRAKDNAVCAWEECNKSFHVPPSRLNPGHNFCSRSCVQKNRHHLNRMQKRLEQMLGKSK